MPGLAEPSHLIEKGLTMVRERIEVAPDDAMYDSIKNQLKWMKLVSASRQQPAPEKTKKLTIDAHYLFEKLHSTTR